jgi:hypothetical protein
MSSTFSAVSISLSLNLNLEFSFTFCMVDAAPWRNCSLPFGDSLAAHEGVVWIIHIIAFLNGNASLHFFVSIIGEVIVLFVGKVPCSDGCAVHFFFGGVMLKQFSGQAVVASWPHFNSIHN